LSARTIHVFKPCGIQHPVEIRARRTEGSDLQQKICRLRANHLTKHDAEFFSQAAIRLTVKAIGEAKCFRIGGTNLCFKNS